MKKGHESLTYALVLGGWAQGRFDLTRRHNKLHRLGITNILLVAEQNLLCTLAYDCTLRVSEASSGYAPLYPPAHSAGLAATGHVEGRFPACTGADLTRWLLSRGPCSRSALLVVPNKHRRRFTALDWNSYNQELLLADELGYVKVWNIYMDKCLKELRVARKPVHSVSVSGKTQVSELGWVFDAPKRVVVLRDSLILTPSCLSLLMLCLLGHWWRRHLCSPAARPCSVGTSCASCSLLCSPDTRMLCLPWCTLKHQAQTVQTMHAFSLLRMTTVCAVGIRTLRGFDVSFASPHRCGGVVHHADHCCWCGERRRYDMACLYRLRERTSEVSCMMYLNHAGLLVTGNDDGSVRFWNPDAASSMAYRHHTNTVSCLAVAHLKRCSYLLSGSFDGCVGGCVIVIAMSRFGWWRKEAAAVHVTLLWVGSVRVFTNGRHIGVWDVTRRRTVKPSMENMLDSVPKGASREDSEILCMCFLDADDDKSKAFAVGGNTPDIQLWSFATWTCITRLRGHTDAITALASDANFLFSGSDDLSIRIWNLANIHDPCVQRRWVTTTTTADVGAAAATAAEVLPPSHAHIRFAVCCNAPQLLPEYACRCAQTMRTRTAHCSIAQFHDLLRV